MSPGTENGSQVKVSPTCKIVDVDHGGLPGFKNPLRKHVEI